VGLSVADARPALETFLAQQTAAVRADISALAPLSGGTLHENWRLVVDFDGGSLAGRQTLVLRADRPVCLASSLSRGQELCVMQRVREAGVQVPEVLWAAGADGPLGRDFFVMRWLPGTAAPDEIIAHQARTGTGKRLASRLGAELGLIQRVRPESGDLPFLKPPARDRAQALVDDTRAYLDTLSTPRPAIEWGLRWLELNKPPATESVLTHGDFRTGNYLMDDEGLVAILDWELAAWGHPLEDLGWFCMRFWRLDAVHQTAGGLAQREDLVGGYVQTSGRRVTREDLHYWEVMANVRWAAISIQQAERHLRGSDKSLELCLTGRRTAEMELEFLQLIAAGAGGKDCHA